MRTSTPSGSGAYAKSRFSDTERLAIAAAIKDHMARKGITRQQLERPNLKIGIIHKALTGGFSDETLAKIEAALDRSFTPVVKSVSTTEAPKLLGGYSQEDASELEGEYVFLRPTFSKSHVFTAYKMTLRWSTERCRLCFVESDRVDSKYTQSGDVYNPPNKPYFSLVTIELGDIRLITLAMPDQSGISRGVLTTLSNPHGVIFTPTSTPVVMLKMDNISSYPFGLLRSGSDFYDKARDLLESVAVEECAHFITNIKEGTNPQAFNI